METSLFLYKILRTAHEAVQRFHNEHFKQNGTTVNSQWMGNNEHNIAVWVHD
jgi:hypothetical protein